MIDRRGGVKHRQWGKGHRYQLCLCLIATIVLAAGTAGVLGSPVAETDVADETPREGQTVLANGTDTETVTEFDASTYTVTAVSADSETFLVNEMNECSLTTEEGSATPKGQWIVDSVAPDDSVNRYEFTAVAGEAIRVVPNTTSEGELAMALYGPDGEQLDANGIGYKYGSSVGAMATQNGTYVFEVYSQRPSSAPYRFQIDTRHPDCVNPHGHQDNDGPQSALPITKDNSTLTGTLAANESDWYAVELTEGERLAATVSHVRLSPGGKFHHLFDNNIEVHIVDASGTDVGQIDGDAMQTHTGPFKPYNAANQTVIAETDGTYYLRLTEMDGSPITGFVDYRLRIESTGSSEQPS